jgi:hypothetical protein
MRTPHPPDRQETPRKRRLHLRADHKRTWPAHTDGDRVIRASPPSGEQGSEARIRTVTVRIPTPYLWMRPETDSHPYKFGPRGNNCDTDLTQFAFVPIVMLQAMSAYVLYTFEEDDAKCFMKLFSEINDEITRIYGLGEDLISIHARGAVNFQ